jgi:2-keto-4-pentenoate hydratase/2-oxohepta-3-ene-1,7-dioic acid hydratase in catechol pathway
MTGLRRQALPHGEQRKNARATDMIVEIPNLLSRAVHVMPLLPSDVNTTGSPAAVSLISVGDATRSWWKAGGWEA